MRPTSRRLLAFRASCRHCARPKNLRATVRIALVVGLVLTAINEGDAIVSGHFTPALGAKVPLNFVVPFIVSNLGLLAARREWLRDRGPRP